MNPFQDSEDYHAIHAHLMTPKHSAHEGGDLETWRHACGCLKTSEKLKRILNSSFPSPPPPPPSKLQSPVPRRPYSYATFPKSPSQEFLAQQYETTIMQCISADCNHIRAHPVHMSVLQKNKPMYSPSFENHPVKEQNYTDRKEDVCVRQEERGSSVWWVLAELFSLIQLSVTATVLALYYIIYCYMQLVYFTLRSVIIFHRADGPMKITIAVVTLTSILVGSNLILRLEKLLRFIFSAWSVQDTNSYETVIVNDYY